MSLEKKTIVAQDPSSFGLPNGWIIEESYRISSRRKCDRFFYEPETGKKFRSLKGVQEHLRGKRIDVHLMERYNLKPTSSSSLKIKKMKTSHYFSNASEKGNVESRGPVNEKKGKRKAVIPLCKMEDKLLAYVFSKLDSSEILVEYGQCHGIRLDFNTLKPRKWVVDVIINLIANQLNTKEKECKSHRMIRSYLPTTFALQVLGININVNKISEIYTSRYLSTLENISKIFIPLNDIDHWFLCVINLQQQEVYILDSLPNKKRKIERLNMVKSIISALCLINLVKYNLQDFSILEPSWVPQQDNIWDCGLYVIKFMQVLDAIPPVTNSSLRVDNSNEFRRKLVLDLILDDNNKEKGWVINKLNKKP